MAATTSVQSSNVVGYQTQTSGEGLDFITAPFTAIGFTTTDIQQVKIDDGGAESIGWGEEILETWQGAPEVVESFFYYDPTMDPNGEATSYYWGDDQGNVADFSVAKGQGLVLTAAEDLTVKVAGQVPSAEDVGFTTSDGLDFFGNPFPTAIDVQTIALDDDGAESIGWGEEILETWQGAPDVIESFFYYDPTMDPNGEATGYYWGDDQGNVADFSVPAGQGLVLTAAEGLDVSIAAPYTAL